MHVFKSSLTSLGKGQKSPWLAYANLLVSIICFSSCLFYWAMRMNQQPSDGSCVELLYPPSPANAEITYILVNYLDLSPSNTIYKGPPTVDREAAWNTITPNLVFSESEKEGLAIVGVALHLNCLKALRQAIYSGPETMHFADMRLSMTVVDQCVEILRRHLMCTFDPTIYLVANSNKSAKGTSPVLGNAHYCRNSTKIFRWLQDNGSQENNITLSRVLG